MLCDDMKRIVTIVLVLAGAYGFVIGIEWFCYANALWHDHYYPRYTQNALVPVSVTNVLTVCLCLVPSKLFIFLLHIFGMGSNEFDKS